jgi:hypothetical protein
MILVYKMELSKDIHVHPSIHSYSYESLNYPYSKRHFIGLSIIKDNNQSQPKIDLSIPVNEFQSQFQVWELRTEGMDLVITRVSKESIQKEQIIINK